MNRMRINLQDASVTEAIKLVHQTFPDAKDSRFVKIFENYYHCKVIDDPNDPWCTRGWLEFEDEKYYTWFTLQNGVEDVSG